MSGAGAGPGATTGLRASRGWLDLTIAVGVGLLAGAALLRLAQSGIDSPSRLFQVLVAAALLCVAGLLRARLPTAAGFATLLASAISATEIVGGLRGLGLVADGASQPAGLALAAVALIAAAGSGLVYAATASRRPAASRWERLGVALVGLAAAATVVAAAWALLEPPTAAVAEPGIGLAPLRWTGRLALIAVGAGLVVGTLRVTWPGAIRAWSAWRALPPGDGGRGASGTLLTLFADELVPERAAHRRRAAEAERARLAADLHAHVLPHLRRAAALAESADAPEDVRAGVRRALEDVEQMLHGRQSIVLEEFGLVAALEWLAERTEQATGLHIELELEGEGVDARDAVLPDVGRAAFRIALLALDNVARHAHASLATVRLRLQAGAIELSIVDDGQVAGSARPDHQPAEPPGRPASGGRGLADMRREAEATGGTLRVTQPPGMSVTAAWSGGAGGRPVPQARRYPEAP